jgi:radical SAM protein with 4Fe4S-binding SPASM domain
VDECARESDSADLAKRLRAVERRIPLEGLLETTFRCNLRCAHCYVSCAAGDAEALRHELPLSRWTRLLDELADAGGLFVTFSGGEPLLRPDFADLYRHALRAGLMVSVFTNGTLLDARYVDLFDEWRPEHIEISLYGSTRETYERVTGVAGSFGRCQRGVEALHARGIALRLKSVALGWNAHELADMERLASGLGVPFRFDGQLNPRVDCRPSPYRELQLAPQTLVAIDALSTVRLDEMRRCLAGSTCSVAAPAPLYGCSAGLTSFTVDPAGRLLLCPLSRRAGFDLRQGAFAEGWHEFLAAARSREWRTSSPCRTCALMPLCDSCAGANEMESGDVEVPVGVFCEIAHRRAQAGGCLPAGHRLDAGCCLSAAALAAVS